MAKWDRVPCAGDWRNQPDLPELASTLGRTEEEVLDAYRFFPGYWDTFRKMSLNQAVIWPDEREAKGSGDFSHFVHEYEEDGVTRYAVAAWYAKHGYWVRPMTVEELDKNNPDRTWVGPLSLLGPGCTDYNEALRFARELFGGE